MRLIHIRCVTLMLGAPIMGHCGCSAPLPTYSWSTPSEAMGIIKERAASITAIQAPCNVVLTSPGGDAASLDAALAAQVPGWLRIRAWKFNTAVFDLTMTPDGLWIMQDDSPEFRNRMSATLDATAVARGWSLLNGRALNEGVLENTDRHDSGPLVINWPAESGVRVSCVVDRRTLLPRAIEAIDGTKPLARYQVLLEDYRMVDGIAWPHTLTMISDAGRAVLRMNSVALNHELASEAFAIPSRAVKQP